MIKKVEKQGWKEELIKFDYSVFITSEWVEAMSNDTCHPIYFNFEQEGDVIGKIAGLIVEGSTLQGNQLYFYAGPAVKNNSVKLFEFCLSELLHFSREKKIAKVNIRPFDQKVFLPADVKGFVRTHWFEYLLKFEGGEIQKPSYGFKQNVKKGRKTGAEFKSSSNPEVLGKLFNLLSETQEIRVGKYGKEYDPIGILNINESSLTKLLNAGAGKIYYAQIGEEIPSAQFNIECADRTYGLLMGSNTFAYKNGVASFIDSNIIEYAFNNQFSYYNLGGVISEEEGGAGIIKYKESMRGVRYDAFGYYSNYLIFPYYFLNPLVKIARVLPSNRVIRAIKMVIGKLSNIR